MDNIKTQTSEQDDSINWRRVQAWVQTGILFLMGLYFLDLALPGGNLSNYINVDNFGWLTWTGAALLFIIAAMNILDLMTPEEDDAVTQHDSSISGSVWSWVFLGIVAIPLILGLGVPSEPLGATAITTELSADVRSIGVQNSSATLTIPSENRNLLDWVRAFSASPDMTEFEGEEISVTGFVYRDARFAGTDNFMLVRFTLSCCVADARPLGLIVENAPEDFAEDTWLNVTGHIEVREFDGVETPIIVIESAEITEQPEQPYLYF